MAHGTTTDLGRCGLEIQGEMGPIGTCQRKAGHRGFCTADREQGDAEMAATQKSA